MDKMINVLNLFQNLISIALQQFTKKTNIKRDSSNSNAKNMLAQQKRQGRYV